MGTPLLRGRTDPKAVINPGDQVRTTRGPTGRSKGYPKELILHFTGEVLKAARRNYDVKLVDKNWWGWLYQLKEGGSKIGLLQSGIGDSFAGLVLELLIAKGATNIIAIGTAGSLQHWLKIGDLVLTDRAIRDEGVSYHYAKPAKYSFPSARLNGRIEETLKKMKLEYSKGTAWTNDAPFRETVSDVKRYQKEGVLCVEMEAASLFSISKFRNIDLSSLHWISDDVSRLEWNPQFNSAAYNQGRDRVIEVAVRAFSNHY
jgi:uridine phosphorylase